MYACWYRYLPLYMYPIKYPTTSSYNASVVKSYNANNTIARFYEKKLFFPYCENALAYYNGGVVVVNSQVERLAQGKTDSKVMERTSV
jgi:hypothetical protein